MVEWIRPVYDRTQADVDYALSQISLGNNATEYKGCFNLTDINRIENNIRYLSDTLNTLLYQNIGVVTKSWEMSDIPNITEIARILGNISYLIQCYYISDDAKALPTTILTYEDANVIEETLHLIKVMIDDMVSSFRECGTFNCGEEG